MNATTSPIESTEDHQDHQDHLESGPGSGGFISGDQDLNDWGQDDGGDNEYSLIGDDFDAQERPGVSAFSSAVDDV